MRVLLNLLLVLFLSSGLAACGNKGSLKSPKQVAVEERKKEHKKAKVQEEQQPDTAAPSQPDTAAQTPAPAQEPK